MAKTFPITLEVEEIALGTVLRKLNDMAGIAKIDLNLGHGGQGAGRKELEQHAAAKGKDKGTRQSEVIKLLMTGPKPISAITQLLGGKPNRAYGIMTQLRKDGLTEAAEGSAMHQLTKKALAQLGIQGAQGPSAPAKVSRGPSGRASPGSGPVILRAALGAGPLTPQDLRVKLTEGGISAKGTSGVLDRAKRDGLIKKNGAGYELTAKGQKIEMTGAAHG